MTSERSKKEGLRCQGVHFKKKGRPRQTIAEGGKTPELRQKKKNGGGAFLDIYPPLLSESLSEKIHIMHSRAVKPWTAQGFRNGALSEKRVSACGKTRAAAFKKKDRTRSMAEREEEEPGPSTLGKHVLKRRGEAMDLDEKKETQAEGERGRQSLPEKTFGKSFQKPKMVRDVTKRSWQGLG